jgi:hypothetical protein
MTRRFLPSASKLAFGLAAGLCVWPLGVARAADAAADKSQYHLFHPTPRERMRGLSTDRPDETESPYTVDAGHFQIESDLIAYIHDHDTAEGADTVVDSWSVAAVNLKAGLLNWMDLQLVLDSYNHVITHDRLTGQKITQSGLGDLTTRPR